MIYILSRGIKMKVVIAKGKNFEVEIDFAYIIGMAIGFAICYILWVI